jgi:hypothetical protein
MDLFMLFGKVNGHGGSKRCQNVGLYSMPHPIAQYHYGSILGNNPLGKKNITANAFSVVIFLLTVYLYEEIIGHESVVL